MKNRWAILALISCPLIILVFIARIGTLAPTSPKLHHTGAVTLGHTAIVPTATRVIAPTPTATPAPTATPRPTATPTATPPLQFFGSGTSTGYQFFNATPPFDMVFMCTTQGSTPMLVYFGHANAGPTSFLIPCDSRPHVEPDGFCPSSACGIPASFGFFVGTISMDGAGAGNDLGTWAVQIVYPAP